MSDIERPDWTEEPADTPAPAPAPERNIARADWTEGEPVEVLPVVAKEQSIARPDWTEQNLPVEASVNQEILAEPIAEPENTLASMIGELAETGHDLEIANESVTGVLEAIEDRAEFEAGFDSLPPGAQKAIVGELAQPGGEWEGMADEDELEQFATTPEGAELVQEWDDDADVNLGRVQARLSRIEANTSPAAIETMWAWFDGLPSAQAKAVLQVLAE